MLFIGCSHFLYGQGSTLDSLQTAIAQAKTVESRLLLGTKLALEYLKTNPDSALYLIEEIELEAAPSGLPEVLVEVRFTKGRIFELRQQLDSALLIYGAAKELAATHKNQLQVASCLIQMGYVHHAKNESQKGLDLLKEALALAEADGNKELQAKATNGIGRVYSFLGEFDSSNKYLDQALEINRVMGDKRGMAEIYTNIANNYGRASQREKAIEYFLLSQELMRQLKDLSGVSHTYRNIGVTHFFDGNYPAALENLHAALQTVEGTVHHADIIQNLDFLGDVYMTIEDYENAQLYWKRADEAYRKAYGEQPNPEFMFKQGRAFLAEKKYTAAIEIFLEAEKLKKEMGQFIDGDLYWNLGQAYEKLSEYAAAEERYLQALALSQSTNTYLVRLKSLYGLGKLAEEKGNLASAKTYYQESFDVAQTAGFKENEMNAASGLYRINKRQNNVAEALRFIEISTGIRDSLFNVEKTRKIAKLEAGFAFEKEKQELEFAQQKQLAEEAGIQRLLWIALGVVGLILSVGLFYFRSKQKANAELSRLNKEILRQKAVVEKQKEKLEELDEAKSRFFTNISHEFRTPLTIISGMIDQIHEKPDQWLEKGSALIKRNTAGLLNLINQILDLRKLESNELKADLVHGDVVHYLRYLIQSYESFAMSKGLQLHFLPAQQAINMDFDSEKLLRIVSNLLSNAVKFTPDGGNVYFQVDTKTEEGQSWLWLRVQDTGIGIPSEDLQHIFGRFYQVDDSSTRQGEGTGIGLALTQELVKLLGGSIRVESTVGQGSTFHVQLPISEKAAKRLDEDLESPAVRQRLEKAFMEPLLLNQEVRNIATDSDTSEKPNLLIVEDNPDVQQYMVACLESQYQLTLADNGQAGVELAIEQVPDLIVSDVMMPVMDGYALTETLKNDERTSHIPIILLTAKADLESKISGLKTGADAYLTKPFEQQELLVRLEKLFELRQKLQARYRSLSPEAAPEDKEDIFVRKVRQAVLEHLSDDTFGIAQLCRAVALSRAQLHNKLKALTGQSTSHFVRSIRLHKAKHLLENSDLNISEVGYEVGFKNPSHFSSAYQEEFGVSPNETRK